MSSFSVSRFRYIFSEVEFAVLCNESIDLLLKLRKNDRLPPFIQYKEYHGVYLYAISKTTYSLIMGLKELKVRRVFDLLIDAHKNGFMIQLQLNYRTLDLRSYM